MAASLEHRSIVITGASSGIGAATAIACAEAGMKVVINARRSDALARVSDRVDATGRNVRMVVGDVTDAATDDALINAANELGGLDAVYSNAGYGLDLDVVDTTDDAVRAIFETNFFASVRFAQRCTRELISRASGGHIILCSSVLGRISLPGAAVYSATKAAQASIASGMRLELRHAQRKAPKRQRIHVSSVHPVTTRTSFFETATEQARTGGSDEARPTNDGTTADGFLTQPPERVARAIVRCLRRPRPEVWTSTSARAMAGMATISPRFGDFVMRRVAKTRKTGGD